MPRQKVLELTSLVAAVAWVAAACSGSSSTPLLTQAQAEEVSVGVAFDVESEIVDAAGTGGTASFTDAPAVGAPALAPPTCTIVRSPSSPTDTDGDGVPDSVSLTFSNCVLSYAGATGAFPETDTLVGTIIVKDPTLSIVDHTVQRIFQQMERIRERQGTTTVRSTETWNGTRTTTRDSTNLTQSETGFQTAFVLPDGTAPLHTRTWTSTFKADAAGSITANQPLPSGLLTVSGQGTWAVGGTSFNITVSTTAPGLHYNATCTAVPRFDSGTLTAVLTANGSTGTVTLSFSGCGVTSGKNS